MDGISFGTDGWRAPVEEFTPARVRAVAQGVASYLQSQGTMEPVAVGYDARETSRARAEEVARVLCANGFDVLMTDRDRPTPIYAHAIVDRGLAGAVVITASHNPPSDNGIKFIPASGAPALPAVTDAIQERLTAPSPRPAGEHGRVRLLDLAASHADHVLELVDADLTGEAIAYDAIHGSGRGTTDAVLEHAGATVHRIRCDRDSTFGGLGPEPSESNLQTLIETVAAGDAALGIANDGDADRVAVVTPERGRLDENLFFAALYDYLLERDGGPAVRTVSTTYLIDRIGEAHGEPVHEVPVGFKWVAEAMAEHDALVGGEESGGFSMRGHVREKDGVLMALVAAAMDADEPLDERVDRLLASHGTVVQNKVSVPCPDEEKAETIAALEGVLPDEVAGAAVESVNTADGFKLLLADGSWILVRPSGTEPVLRVYAEALDEARVDSLLEAGAAMVDRVS